MNERAAFAQVVGRRARRRGDENAVGVALSILLAVDEDLDGRTTTVAPPGTVDDYLVERGVERPLCVDARRLQPRQFASLDGARLLEVGDEVGDDSECVVGGDGIE